jgi:hypothetical protein
MSTLEAFHVGPCVLAIARAVLYRAFGLGAYGLSTIQTLAIHFSAMVSPALPRLFLKCGSEDTCHAKDFAAKNKRSVAADKSAFWDSLRAEAKPSNRRGRVEICS